MFKVFNIPCYQDNETKNCFEIPPSKSVYNQEIK